MSKSQQWPLKYILDGLKLAKKRPADTEEVCNKLNEFLPLDLVSYDFDSDTWGITPAGKDLLNLLEAAAREYRKR